MITRTHRAGPVATTDAGPIDASRLSRDFHSSTRFYADGLDQAISNASTDWWSIGAAVAIRQLALGGYFDADSLLDLVGEPPHPAYVGAAFAAAQRSAVI